MNDMFGESYRKLNPLVNAGTENIKRLEQEAYDLGVVMDEQVVAKLDAAAATAKKTENEFKGVLRTIGAFFQEAFSFQGVKSAFEYLLEKSGGNIITSTNRSKIPPYANGTYNHVGGYALVGEKGPEIVELPRGSRVYPNGTGPQMGTVNNYSITISAKDVREFNDIVRIAEGQKQSIRMGYGRR